MKEKENKAIEILNQLLDIGQNDKFYDKGLINEERIVQEWREKNGAASFDLKERDIILHDGGLFSVEKTITKRWPTKMVIREELSELGGYPVEFKRKWWIPFKEKVEDYDAYLWFDELDDTIDYLKRMRKMLHKLGYKTRREGTSK